jgi:hypothetical protein
MRVDLNTRRISMGWFRRGSIGLVIVLCWVSLPSGAQAGWITLTSGTGGSTVPADSSEFWYGSASTPLLVIDEVSGAGTIRAVTGRGLVLHRPGDAVNTAIPPGALQLGVDLAPDGGSARVLTASVLGSDGTQLGSGSVVVPEGGWWVLGLGPTQQPAPDPLPSSAPTPGVPEPATLVLPVSGGFMIVPWLRRRNRARVTNHSRNETAPGCIPPS